MTVAVRYTDELKARFNFLATWYPGTLLTLGTIGTINDARIFVAEVISLTRAFSSRVSRVQMLAILATSLLPISSTA